MSAPLLPPDSIMPPESPRELIGNAALILRANTKVTLESAFQPIGAYDRVVVLLDRALEQLDGKRS